MELMNRLAKIPVEEWVNAYLSHQEYKTSTTLCAIMTSYGSDKGDKRHNYTTLYAKLFGPWRHNNINLFELGIGTNYSDIPYNMGKEGTPGASLHGWALFFPKAHIFGADIDQRILFQTPTIKTYYCDQRQKSSIHNLFSNEDLHGLQFDIMIEDGLHEFDANLNFLQHSIHKLKEGGIYIIEDLTAHSRVAFIKLIPYLRKEYQLKYIEVIIIPSKLNHFDNALLVIQK
ncbi:hypothetical protein NEOC84_000381|nr:hypothetical protein [Neochlamydia sp. AcF84]